MTAMLILTGLNVAISATTLAVVLGGAKKLKEEVDGVKTQTNANVTSLKRSFKDAVRGLDKAIDDLDLKL